MVDDLADRRRNARERSQEADLLRLGLDEITRVDPQPGEDDELKAEAQRLEHAEGLRTAAQLAQQCVAGGVEATDDTPDAAALLGTARRTLEAQAGTDPALGELAGPAGGGGHAGRRRGRRAVRLPRPRWTPTRPACRRSTSAAPRCARSPASTPTTSTAWSPGPSGPGPGCPIWTPPTTLLDELDREASRLAGEVADLAGRVSASRQEAAVRFAEQVTVELAGLAMPHARIEVGCRPVAGRAEPSLPVNGAEVGVGPDGADEVELRLLAHPGAPALPLQRGASGGELSRVMLAIEVVFAGSGGPPDAGLRRGRRRCRRSGGGGDRSAAGPAGPQSPGARGHPPAAGRRVRRPAPGGGEGHRGRGDHQRRAGGGGHGAGRGSWPACSPVCRTPIWVSPTPRNSWPSRPRKGVRDAPIVSASTPGRVPVCFPG